MPRSPFVSSTRCRTRSGSARPVGHRGPGDAGGTPSTRLRGRRRQGRGGRRRIGRRANVRVATPRAPGDRGAGGISGLVILGSGSIPLATSADRRAFIDAAGASGRTALANDRFSADIVAIARADELPAIPDLPGDNALPRWLSELAGYEVRDLRRRWRLGVDIDGPQDLVLIGRRGAPRRPRSTPS